MSELAREPSVLERMIDEFVDKCREPSAIEAAQRNLEERHLALFRIREP